MAGSIWIYNSELLPWLGVFRYLIPCHCTGWGHLNQEWFRGHDLHTDTRTQPFIVKDAMITLIYNSPAKEPETFLVPQVIIASPIGLSWARLVPSGIWMPGLIPLHVRHSQLLSEKSRGSQIITNCFLWHIHTRDPDALSVFSPRVILSISLCLSQLDRRWL